MPRTPTERMIAADERAVAAHRYARWDAENRRFLVRSETHADLSYAVRVYAVGETVVFVCDHTRYDHETGRRVAGRLSSRTFVPCKHGARVARRLRREGLLRWDGTAWRPTERALALAGAPEAPDPFADLPR